ncbi:TRAP transporter small permease [Donghicola mangrovi]|uniref:TRAP transporter small permease protein n=1 Tax=Donghicola mangrovi TaxID=2729614 RepID=A0A850Q6Z7_9RHOB|nr:TRAP transporter small permease [Donghicola mangrovi]NVO25557.1 TRAP transporter small permease [Donghicola mangrovi]
MIKTIDLWLGRFCLAVAGLSISAMALVAFVDSIGRKFDMPLYGGSEYVIFALLTFFFSALPLVVRDNSHIRVGLFADLYKARLSRIEALFTGTLEVLALCAFTYMIFDQANRLERFGTLSVYFELPMAPLVYMASLFCLIAIWFASHNVWLMHSDATLRPHAIPDDSEDEPGHQEGIRKILRDTGDYPEDETPNMRPQGAVKEAG